jgi:hypothetical protein
MTPAATAHGQRRAGLRRRARENGAFTYVAYSIILPCCFTAKPTPLCNDLPRQVTIRRSVTGQILALAVLFNESAAQ